MKLYFESHQCRVIVCQVNEIRTTTVSIPGTLLWTAVLAQHETGNFIQGAAEMLESGYKAPQFSLPNQDGEIVSLAEQAGSNVIFWFYPRASTPG
jgi:hypothetical protein